MLSGTMKDQRGYKPPQPENFVILKSGRKVEGIALDSVKKGKNWKDTKRQNKKLAREQASLNNVYSGKSGWTNLGDTTLRSGEIVSIINGDNWVTKVPKKGNGEQSFATMRFKGDKINIYTSISTSRMTYMTAGGGTMTGTSHSNNYYIQNGDFGKLERFDYKSLRRIIPAKDATSKYLVSYKKHKTVNNAIRWGGFGTTIVGIALLASGVDGINTVGAIMIPSGVGILTIGGIMQSKNIRHRLHRAFYEYNGIRR